MSLSLAMLLFASYAALSVRLHQRMRTTGYDLGIFEQAVRAYADGQLPIAELKGPDFPLLGDHFSPVLALLAPFYQLWPTPVTLLVAQAALLAVAVVPLARWARTALGRGAALAVGLGYGASWGIAEAVGFDFHEVSFAAPLLAFSLTALGQGRLRASAWWALPLLLVKEDLGLTVAVIGVLIARRGGRRVGWATAAAGVLGTVLATLVVIPSFNPSGNFTYSSSLPGQSSADAGPEQLLFDYTVGLITPDAKAQTLLTLLAMAGLVAVRSSLLCAVIPTLLWRFASENPVYWGTHHHYSVVLMPVLFAAFVDALTKAETDLRAIRYGLATSFAVTALLFPQHPLWQLTQSDLWDTDPRLASAHRLLDRIPNGATVAASNRLVPQLTSRTSVTLLGIPNSRPNPQWIIVDTARPQGFPINPDLERGLISDARAQGYRVVADEHGYLLLHR